MARMTYVWDTEAHKLVPAAEFYSRPRPDTRSHLSRPYYIGDNCEFVSMATGQMVTSKAKYRADLRARGLVEVGNDPAFRPENARPRDATTDLPPVEAEVAQAIEQLGG